MQNNEKKYSFQSVGLLKKDKDAADSKIIVKRPIGFKTPLIVSSHGASSFEMHHELSDQIKDNLRNLLMTNHGERLLLPDFGANLSELAFEFGSENTDMEAVRRIGTCLQKYMPYVTPITFTPIRKTNIDGSLLVAGVRMTYSVPQLGLVDQAVEAEIFVVG